VLREPVPSHALAPPNAFVGRDFLFELPSLHGRSAFSLSRFARLIARLSLKIAEMPRVSQGRKTRLASLRDFFYLPSGNPSAKALGYFRIRGAPIYACRAVVLTKGPPSRSVLRRASLAPLALCSDL